MTLVTGKFCCDFVDLYTACNDLLDDVVFTHTLGRAVKFIKPRLQELFPWSVDVSEDFPEKLYEDSDEEYSSFVLDWLNSISREHGEIHDVPVMSKDWVYVDPLSLLRK